VWLLAVIVRHRPTRLLVRAQRTISESELHVHPDRPLLFESYPSRPAVPPGPYLVAGVGRAGSAAAVALAELAGASSVIAWDGLDRQRERAARAELAQRGIASFSGDDGIGLLDRYPAPRTLVKSPGLPRTQLLIQAALHRGLEVIDEAELGWRLDPRPFVAVTGTNGKSTTVSLVAAVLAAAGLVPVRAGNTTFGPPLSSARAYPGNVVAAELSSFQLEGSPNLFPDAALLTNLTQDHQSRHGTMTVYGACKRLLFVREGRVVPVAAVGVDQPFGDLLANELKALGSRVIGFGSKPAADLRVLSNSATENGRSKVHLRTSAGERVLHTKLFGMHNALNAAGALALAVALEVDFDTAAQAVSAAESLPGRFEPVATRLGFDVIVDFAHNPDGVARALDAGRELLQLRHARGRLIAVVSVLELFGQPHAMAMGAAARMRADHLILTTQRWLPGERGDRVTPGLREGAESVTGASLEIVPDRRSAIATAIECADVGDVLMVLGRGNVAGDLYGRDDRPAPFDDRQVVRQLVAQRR
jgi:UDP-N-acetylmuramoylalanine-D-glutamate ligase